MFRYYIFLWGNAVILSAMILSFAAAAHADAPPPEQFRERIPVQERVEQRRVERERMREPHERTMKSDESGWIFGVSPVVTVNFFDEDRERPNYGLHFNARHSDVPLNLRIGVEGSDFDSEQDALVQTWLDAGGGEPGPDITYLRFPVAVEYWMPLGERGNLYAGPGYNLIRMDDLVEDTVSGLHVSGRLGYEIIEDSLELTAEGGYLWTEDLETPNGDVDFSGAFVQGGMTYILPF